MEYKFPLTIDSGHGEVITFTEIVKESDGDKLISEGFCQPHVGPPMHVHFKQDEGFTVVSGKAGIQLLGQEPKYLLPGESMTLLRNQPHRFWNEGEEPLHIQGWAKPANNLVFFLSALYDARRAGSNGRPEMFDGAYLMVRYKTEFAMADLPVMVQKVVIPLTYQLGKLLGKYKKFKDAPEPIK